MMDGLKRVVLQLVIIAQSIASRTHDATSVSPPAIAEYHIVTINGTIEEKYAAEMLQLWLERSCECTIPISYIVTAADCASADASPQLAVGYGAAVALVAGAGGPPLNASGLEAEGFVLWGDASSFSIAVTGGTAAPRGCIYGVYGLLERLGFGFWDYNATTVPQLTTAWPGPIDVRETPAVRDWRHCNNANLELQSHADFSIALRNNNNGGVGVYTSRDVHKVGGGVRWASPPGFVHTSFTIVDPTSLRATHPEWFGPNQLCWTNTSLVKYVISRVKAYLDNDPNATVISVTQNDGGGAGICHTPNEDAVTKEEGSPSGPLLRAVNAVADAIAEDYPGVLVETLAYQYTREPPKITRPRPNVVIRLSNIECDFRRPIDDPSSSVNAAFAADLQAWAKISNRTWIWTYVTDFANWVQPWPDYYTMASNIRFYINNGVTGVYQEGQYMAYGGDLQTMKSWVGQRLMWNPNLSTDSLISQFLLGYYGASVAPHVKTHIDIFMASANASGAEALSIGAAYTDPYLSPSACVTAMANLREAEVAAAASSPGDVDPADALARVKALELGVMYVILLRWDEMRAWATASNVKWPAAASKEEALSEFTSQYRKSGMDIRVGFDPENPIPCGTNVSECHVYDGKLMPESCGLACALMPCNHATGYCETDCGLSEGCHGLSWFTNTVMNGPPTPTPPPGPPGKRSFPDCWGYDCGPGSVGASPPTTYGDRCFPAAGGSSGLGPFVCCNASIPEKWQSKSPCNLSASIHGCWWPVSAGCPGVDPRTVCPLARPYEYGNDDAGWYCCATDEGPRSGECDGSCCLVNGTGASGGCQGRAPCYH